MSRILNWQLIICLTLLIQVGGLQSSDYSSLKKADAHLHLIDFLQNTDYLTSDGEYHNASPYHTPKSGERGGRITAILHYMDKANVEYSTVIGMPFLKKWSKNASFRSRYYLDSSSRVVLARDTDYIVALSIEDFLKSNGSMDDRKRLFPFIAGVDATDLGAVDLMVKRIKEFPGMWEGVGEIMSRHDDLTNLTTGERPVADHPSIHRMADFAAEAHLPMSIHHNIAPISPSNKTKEPSYLEEFIRLVDEHPDTVFIWCHAGISRRILVDDLPSILDGFLERNNRWKHVYIDLSWVVYEMYIYDEKNGVDNRKEWAHLIKKYPKTFMIGSDKVTKFGGYKAEMDKFEPLYDALKEVINHDELIQNIAYNNFTNLMLKLRKKRGGLGAILDPSYRYPEDKYTEPLGFK